MSIQATQRGFAFFIKLIVYFYQVIPGYEHIYTHRFNTISTRGGAARRPTRISHASVAFLSAHTRTHTHGSREYVMVISRGPVGIDHGRFYYFTTWPSTTCPPSTLFMPLTSCIYSTAEQRWSTAVGRRSMHRTPTTWRAASSRLRPGSPADVTAMNTDTRRR